MKKKIAKKVFLNFLRKNNCLQEYLMACKKTNLEYNNATKSNISLRSYLQKREIMDKDNNFNVGSICNSFTWSKYPIKKGNVSNWKNWKNLHEKWNDFLHNNNFEC